MEKTAIHTTSSASVRSFHDYFRALHKAYKQKSIVIQQQKDWRNTEMEIACGSLLFSQISLSALFFFSAKAMDIQVSACTANSHGQTQTYCNFDMSNRCISEQSMNIWKSTIFVNRYFLKWVQQLSTFNQNHNCISFRLN